MRAEGSSTISQLPAAQNNLYAITTYFGVAHADSSSETSLFEHSSIRSCAGVIFALDLCQSHILQKEL